MRVKGAVQGWTLTNIGICKRHDIFMPFNSVMSDLSVRPLQNVPFCMLAAPAPCIACPMKCCANFIGVLHLAYCVIAVPELEQK